MLIVKCPNCGHNQKTDPKIKVVGDMTRKVKRCVYCGKSFKIHSNLPSSNIVEVVET